MFAFVQTEAFGFGSAAHHATHTVQHQLSHQQQVLKDL